MAKISKLITFTEEAWAMAETIALKKGFNNPQEAVRYAIGEIGSDPAYVEIAKMRLLKQQRTPEEKAIEKVSNEEAKAKAKAEKEELDLKNRVETGRNYCRLLEGKVYKDEKGYERCSWRGGSYLNPKNASIVPNDEYLENVTEEHLSTQFTNEADRGKPVFKEVFVEALKNCGEKW